MRVFQECPVRFTFRLPALRYGLRRSSRAFFQLTAVLCLATLILMAVISPSIAQKAGGGNRAVKVEVAEVKTQIIANLIDVQGRMTAGPFEAVTAVTNAITELVNCRLVIRLDLETLSRYRIVQNWN